MSFVNFKLSAAGREFSCILHPLAAICMLQLGNKLGSCDYNNKECSPVYQTSAAHLRVVPQFGTINEYYYNTRNIRLFDFQFFYVYPF